MPLKLPQPQNFSYPAHKGMVFVCDSEHFDGGLHAWGSDRWFCLYEFIADEVVNVRDFGDMKFPVRAIEPGDLQVAADLSRGSVDPGHFANLAEDGD